MNKYRISLWQHGICVIRSQPIDGEIANSRIAWWEEIFGRTADIRTEIAA